MQEKNTKKTVTLRELGKRLSIGTDSKKTGSLCKDLDFGFLKTRDEREIARQLKGNSSVAEQASTVLRRVLKRAGEHNFETEENEGRKSLYLSQMYLADVFTAYFLLRIETLGKEVGMNIKCGVCSKQYKFKGDLETMDVVTVDDIRDAYAWYTLKRPVKMAGKEVTKVKIGPQRWSTVLSTDDGDLRLARLAAVRGSICGLNDDPDEVILTENDVDEIFKIDLEGMYVEIDANVCGPQMMLDLKCPHCGSEYQRGVDWRYDNFFSTSSQ